MLGQDSLVWVNRDGEAVEPLLEGPLDFPRHPRLSPDGRRLALTVRLGGPSDVWVYDLDGRPPIRLTFEGGNAHPIWTPDGTRVAFTSNRAGAGDLYWIPADGSSLDPELLLPNQKGVIPL